MNSEKKKSIISWKWTDLKDWVRGRVTLVGKALTSCAKERVQAQNWGRRAGPHRLSYHRRHHQVSGRNSHHHHHLLPRHHIHRRCRRRVYVYISQRQKRRTCNVQMLLQKQRPWISLVVLDASCTSCYLRRIQSALSARAQCFLSFSKLKTSRRTIELWGDFMGINK